MRIPDAIQVEWATEDGGKYTASTPIKSRLNGRYPTHTIEVRFNNDQIEVFERTYTTPAQRLDFKIYPSVNPSLLSTNRHHD